MQMVQQGKRLDKGLNFHLSRGAKLVRKTVGEWIPQDKRNGGYGVVIWYDLELGTGIVQLNEQVTKSANSLKTYDVICGVVASTVSKIMSISLETIVLLRHIKIIG